MSALRLLCQSVLAEHRFDEDSDARGKVALARIDHVQVLWFHSPIAKQPLEFAATHILGAQNSRDVCDPCATELMQGLEGRIHFAESLESYEVDAAGVTARFASGREARGAVLIGADGIRSVVRQQRAPDARMMDTGLRSIYGRLPIASARALLPGFAVADAFTLAADARRFVMGLGPMVFAIAPQNAKDFAPDAPLQPQADYIAFILAGRKELFEDGLRSASVMELHRAAFQLVAAWPDSTRALIDAVEPSSLFFVEMFTSVPCKLAPSPRVTLLGDAIHAMSPSLGRGANIALLDSTLLGKQLICAAQGELDLSTALETYEAEMTRYGFQVVRQSVETGTRVLGQDPLPDVH